MYILLPCKRNIFFLKTTTKRILKHKHLRNNAVSQIKVYEQILPILFRKNSIVLNDDIFFVTICSLSQSQILTHTILNKAGFYYQLAVRKPLPF